MRFLYGLIITAMLISCTSINKYYLVSNDQNLVDKILKKQPAPTNTVSEKACSKVYLFVPSIDTRTPEEVTHNLLAKHPPSNAFVNWHYQHEIFWVFFYSSFCTTVEMTPVKI